MRPSKEMNFKVLHSNFNYSRHYPGYVGNDIGYYSFPFTKQHEKQTTHMDPFCSEGKYEIITNNKKYDFSSSKRIDIDMETEVLQIKRTNGELPARINIVLSAFLKGAKCKLPMESQEDFITQKDHQSIECGWQLLIGKIQK